MIRKDTATRVLVLSALVLTACDQGAEPSAPAQEEIAAAMMVLPPEQATDPAVLDRAIPGFGGMYIDEQGRPVVYVTDMRQAARARSALSAFAVENDRSPSEIVVLQAAYKHGDLNKWYNASWADAMDTQGAVFSDLDEANNRLLFGVEHAGAANGVRARLRAHGVPESAFAVEVVEPIHNAATLRDVVNPKVGGLQIHFGNYLCTLGFNANFGGTNSFVTNSHCTNTQGGVEGTVYYQPTSTAAPSPIATEVADPQYVRGGGTGCPKSKRCRYSDSSRANYNAGVSFSLGGIATTNGSNLTITGTLNITSEATGTSPVPVGGTVTKVGRTTGTSTGTVTNTCVNTGVSGSNIMQLCQTFVNASVGGGDSGSSVRQGNTLVGILWGGNGAGTQFVFSPLASIKQELGSFTAH